MITEFTFGIVTYNSERTVVETLESIKYQIEHFGNGIVSYLVLSDDCSTDRTLYIVREWLKNNNTLFRETSILTATYNSGLCVNYAQMVCHIKTEHFIQIAGDDLISSENIYEKLSTLGENELRVHLTLKFCGTSISNDPKDLRRQLFYSKYKHTNRRDIVLLETLSPYSTVEICLFKKHYSDACMEYIKNYRNFEDDTSLYYVLKNNQDVTFRFVMTPIILYRREEKSLTKMVDTTSQIAFLDDLYRFRKETFKREKNIFVKILLGLMLWDNFLMKHRFDASKCLDRKIKRLIEQRNDINIKKNKELSEYLAMYNKTIKRETDYLKEIQNYAIDFLKNSAFEKQMET